MGVTPIVYIQKASDVAGKNFLASNAVVDIHSKNEVSRDILPANFLDFPPNLGI